MGPAERRGHGYVGSVTHSWGEADVAGPPLPVRLPHCPSTGTLRVDQSCCRLMVPGHSHHSPTSG